MELLKNCLTSKYCNILMLAFTYASCTTCKSNLFSPKVNILHILIPLCFQVICNRSVCKTALMYLYCKIMFEKWCVRRTRKTLRIYSRMFLDLLTFLRGDRVKKTQPTQPIEGGRSIFVPSISTYPESSRE